MTLFSNYFYRSLLRIIILLLLYLFFPFYVFISYFKFLFVPFFFIFFPFLPFLLLCVKWVHHMLHLRVIIFSFILTGLLKILREERLDHPNYHPNHQQNSSRFSLYCCIIIHVGLELHGQFYTLFLSTLRYVTH